jgi:hypothetical protein
MVSNYYLNYLNTIGCKSTLSKYSTFTQQICRRPLIKRREQQRPYRFRWTSRLREVTLDVQFWQKLVQYHGNSAKAPHWVQLQINFFSNRHLKASLLRRIISSITFVEMANPQPESPFERHKTSKLQNFKT